VRRQEGVGEETVRMIGDRGVGAESESAFAIAVAQGAEAGGGVLAREFASGLDSIRRAEGPSWG
jgi:hypothetical protein